MRFSNYGRPYYRLDQPLPQLFHVEHVSLQVR